MGYYDCLELKEKVAYDQLLFAFHNRSASRVLTTNLRYDQVNSIHRVIDALILDHPEVFYVEIGNCYLRNYHGMAQFRFTCNHAPATICEIDRRLHESWRALERKLDPETSARKKYEMIALEVASKIKFRKTGKYSDYTIAGPMLRQTGVCEALAKLFACYCRLAGLPVLIVSGLTTGPHSWNQVWLDGQVMYLDITQLQVFPLFYKTFPNRIFFGEAELHRRRYRQTPLKPDCNAAPIIKA